MQLSSEFLHLERGRKIFNERSYAMKKSYMLPRYAALFVGLVFLYPFQAGADTQHMSEDAKIIHDSTNIFNSFASSREIPKNVIDKSAGIVIIPGLFNAGLIIGGEHGKGVLMSHSNNQWSLPVVVSLTGGSLGAQIGAQSTDLVLVFMDPQSIKQIESGNFTLGVNASVLAGHSGEESSASFGNNLVYAYQRSEGAFAGATITGSSLSIDRDQTVAYYQAPQQSGPVHGYYGNKGSQMVEDILAMHADNLGQIPQGAKELQHLVQNYSSGKP